MILYSRVLSFALVGVDGHGVEVEVDLAPGLPSFEVVGLTDSAGRETRERVRAALRNSGLPFTPRRVTVNLAGVEGRRGGPGFDLPIALGYLAAVGTLQPSALEGLGVVGELSLEGRLRPVNGALAFALAAKGLVQTLIMPIAMAKEAAQAPGVTVIGADTLGQVVDHLRGLNPLAPVGKPAPKGRTPWTIDLSDVRGQVVAKSMLEVAAAGGHNLLFVGPPGVGKSMLLRRLPTILPVLQPSEALEVAKIHSAAGLPRELSCEPPFRAPHHTASVAALVGGGDPVRPGELSLAHRGVLFLDEFPEFDRAALQALRQPLEEGSLTIARVRGKVRLPAQLLLAAAANPCPCGQGQGFCSCGPAQAARYQERLAGPLVDRIDLTMKLARLTTNDLSSRPSGEPSSAIRQRVAAARERQAHRLTPYGLSTNGQLPPALLKQLCPLTADCLHHLNEAYRTHTITLRGYDRAIRVARTLADLAGAERILEEHVATALFFRTQIEEGVQETG